MMSETKQKKRNWLLKVDEHEATINILGTAVLPAEELFISQVKLVLRLATSPLFVNLICHIMTIIVGVQYGV